jgi:hypothetical protein
MKSAHLEMHEEFKKSTVDAAVNLVALVGALAIAGLF